MTTRLRQGRIHSSDPAYPTLLEELKARRLGNDGTGYMVPAGGIPRTDMTADVQAALEKVSHAYILPETGIASADLSQSIRDSLSKANTAYQKPAEGIVIADLEPMIQEQIRNFTKFYASPSTGIPEVDMDPEVKQALKLARSAYQLPTTGISKNDLAQAVKDSLGKADSAYQMPNTGMPISQLAEPIVSDAALNPFRDHVKDQSIHITDHVNLKNVGTRTHQTIDNDLDRHQSSINGLINEITDARDVFTTLGNRISTAMGKNAVYRIDSKKDWEQGTLDNLIVSDDGIVGFPYKAGPLLFGLYDVSASQSFAESNRVANIQFSDGITLDRGTSPWISGSSLNTYVGLQAKFYLYAPVSGSYEFSAVWSGRFRMSIGGRLIYNDAVNIVDGVSGLRKGRIDLKGGRLYPVQLEGWYYATGPRVLNFNWVRPDRSMIEVIPGAFMNQTGYSGGLTGDYVSPVVDLKDSEVSRWFIESDFIDWWTEDYGMMEIATSADGINFSTWTKVQTNTEMREIVPKRFFKIRIMIRRNAENYTPSLVSYQVRYISSTHNSFYQEITEARNAYVSLRERFDAIDTMIQNLGELQMQFNAADIHPEYFASMRLASIELTLLKKQYNDLATSPDFTLIYNGFVDPFKTMNNIDTRSKPLFRIDNEAVVQQANTITYDVDADWAKFNLDKLDYVNGSLQLAQIRGANGAGTTSLSSVVGAVTNQFNIGSVGAGKNTNVAQPFYTMPFSGTIKSIYVPVGNVGSNGWVGPFNVHICPAREDGAPDLRNTVWSKIGESIHYDTYPRQLKYDNIYAPVTPNKKYFLVIEWTDTDYYDDIYFAGVSSSNLNVPKRLTQDNPENKYLYPLRAKIYSPSSAADWTPASSTTFLSFTIEETTLFEAEGYAERIEDFGGQTEFTTSSYVWSNQTKGSFSLDFASSLDGRNWSAFNTDITKIPSNRFLKTRVRLTRGMTNYETPTLDVIRVGIMGKNASLWSKPLTMDKVPTHAYLWVDQPAGQHLTFDVSRDGGVSWMPIKPNTETPLFKLLVGKSLCVRANYNSAYANERINGWALQGIVSHDITAQNITALQEEFLAAEGQKRFTLSTPYPISKNALEVFVNGVYQSLTRDYKEIDEYTIEFNEPLYGPDADGKDADVVTFRVAAGAYGQHDASFVKEINKIHDVTALQNEPHTVEYYYDGDKLAQENYTGDNPRSVDYTYRDDGKIETITTTTTQIIKTERMVYDDNGKLKTKQVEIVEVSP